MNFGFNVGTRALVQRFNYDSVLTVGIRLGTSF
jgi:hypothetical protein